MYWRTLNLGVRVALILRHFFAIAYACAATAACSSRSARPRNGIPSARSSIRPSKSLRALVVIEIVRPFTFSILSRLSSAKMVCSRKPSE